ERAYQINAIGPRNLAVVCEKLGAKLVQVSTDYVFSGEFNNKEVVTCDASDVLTERIECARLSQPWKEDDVVAPQSIYGTSKLMGEELVKSLCHKYFIIRTAWLYGEGNNFVRTMLKLAETNKELNVVGDQFGNPTYAKDLAVAIVNLVQTEYYGTYHGTCEGTCSWYDFASKIFEIKGIEIKVNKVTSEQFVRPAKRPFYSSLDNFMLKLNGLNTFRTWEESLEDYLDNK
ncbi:MAG: NAD(P)-dependent oxidoreductase, partial [Niameybacter sp.]